MRYNGGRILICVAAPCREPGKGCRRIDRNEFRERADHAQAGSDPGGLHIALLLALGGNTPWRKTGAQQPPYTELFYLSGPLRIQAYLYRSDGLTFSEKMRQGADPSTSGYRHGAADPADSLHWGRFLDGR